MRATAFDHGLNAHEPHVPASGTGCSLWHGSFVLRATEYAIKLLRTQHSVA
jgi:hypothetical protein